MEAESAKSEARISQLFGNALLQVSMSTLILDLQLKEVAFINKAATKLLYSINLHAFFDEVICLLRKDTDLVEADDFYQRINSEIYHHGKHIGVTVIPMEKRNILLFLEDITESRRIEAALEAQEIVHSIESTFIGIRHEMGNPVNAIKTTVGVLTENLDNFSREKIAECVTRIEISVTKLEELLNVFRNFNMTEAVQPEEIRLSEFIASLLSYLLPASEIKNLSIVQNISADCGSVLADPRALNQIITNLLANSISALEEVAHPVISFRAKRLDNFCILSIEDNGQGMEKEVLLNAFKPFYTTKTHGTGMGLVMVKKLLSRMNGQINLTSNKSIGTTVSLRLPMAGSAS